MPYNKSFESKVNSHRVWINKYFFAETIELSEKCKKCDFYKNPENRHRPCDYKYCGDRGGMDVNAKLHSALPE